MFCSLFFRALGDLEVTSARDDCLQQSSIDAAVWGGGRAGGRAGTSQIIDNCMTGWSSETLSRAPLISAPEWIYLRDMRDWTQFW